MTGRSLLVVVNVFFNFFYLNYFPYPSLLRQNAREIMQYLAMEENITKAPHNTAPVNTFRT